MRERRGPELGVLCLRPKGVLGGSRGLEAPDCAAAAAAAAEADAAAGTAAFERPAVDAEKRAPPANNGLPPDSVADDRVERRHSAIATTNTDRSSRTQKAPARVRRRATRRPPAAVIARPVDTESAEVRGRPRRSNDLAAPPAPPPPPRIMIYCAPGLLLTPWTGGGVSTMWSTRPESSIAVSALTATQREW